jgi:hypothetical protein
MDMLAIVVSPVLTAIGVLISYRVNEKCRSPKLRIANWDHFKFNSSIRVFVEVENKPGREIARDARTLITITKIKDGKECPLETSDLVPRDELRGKGDPLVPPENPRVEGEYVPWMVPESPYQSFGLYGILLKHVTNIASGQRCRAAILDVIKNEKGEYYLLVFSEYGTEEEVFREPIGHPIKHYEEKHIRIIRCALRPGKYRFYLSISADKTYPAIGIFEVDTINGLINFLELPMEMLNLKDLLR